MFKKLGAVTGLGAAGYTALSKKGKRDKERLVNEIIDQFFVVLDMDGGDFRRYRSDGDVMQQTNSAVTKRVGALETNRSIESLDVYVDTVLFELSKRLIWQYKSEEAVSDQLRKRGYRISDSTRQSVLRTVFPETKSFFDPLDPGPLDFDE